MTTLTQARKTAPDQAGLYLLRVSTNVLYVGKANSLKSRLGGWHHVLDNITERLSVAANLAVLPTPTMSEADLLGLEAFLINELDPCLNQIRPAVPPIAHQHIKLLRPYMPSKSTTTPHKLAAVTHPEMQESTPTLTQVFMSLVLDRNSIPKGGVSWELPDDTKTRVAAAARALSIKPNEVIALASDLLLGLIVLEVDPDTSMVSTGAIQQRIAAAFGPVELYSNPRCLKRLDLWMTEPERPTVADVCLGVLLKDPAQCNIVDLAHITHRLNCVYGEYA